jgi:hypothetical protein
LICDLIRVRAFEMERKGMQSKLKPRRREFDYANDRVR